MLWRGDEMSFPQKVADEVLVRCGRHCCLCGRYAGGKIELHHIKQVADGGEDTADNCIPLCLDCHAEVKAYVELSIFVQCLNPQNYAASANGCSRCLL